MLKALIDFLLNRKGHPVQHDTPNVPDAPVAPYKVEAPAPAKCGCGRSQSGLCVGLHKLTAEQWAVHADNPNKAPVKKPRAKKAAEPKVAEKPAAKKPAKPRAKKAKE